VDAQPRAVVSKTAENRMMSVLAGYTNVTPAGMQRQKWEV
jgi:hypothetical protein